jgi:hypothetical protein
MPFGKKGRGMAERPKMNDERRGPKKLLERDLGCQKGKNEMT